MPAAPTDFRLYHGNDLEVLAGLLAAELARPVAGRSLLAPDTVLIPQPAMRRWLQKTLAQAHGIAANLRFLAPGEFVQAALDANVPATRATPVGDAARLRWRLWRLLADPGAMQAPVFWPLQPVLAGGDPALSAWQLADELAGAFEKYQAWRRDWLRRWDRGADGDDWQAELWRLATKGLTHRGKRLDAYLSRFDGNGTEIPAGLPPRVFAFACQNVSPDVLRVIASAARGGILHFYFLSPVRGWWGDLQTASERLRADPEAVFADADNSLLRANGAAGRDFVRTLFSYEVVHPSFEQPVYVAPDPVTRTGLLHRLQRDLLERAPVQSAGLSLTALADASLQVHSCHTRLREVQVLHEQLRALLETDPLLQPREIAVLTPDIDQYAPFVQAVFGGESAGARQIPYALTDGSAIATQPVAEAFAKLLALPGARFGAEEVLAMLSVSAIAERLLLEAGGFAQLREWLLLAGARWGLNAEHRAELGAPAEAAFTWAWALDRLLLGHASGSDADIAGVAPLPLLEAGTLAVLDRLLQGLRLLAHWQRALSAPRPAAEWGKTLAQLLTDFFPERARDAGDRQALDALRALAARFATQAKEAEVDEAVPASVMRAWFTSALAEGDMRQPFLTGGVTFGQMVPMRLVPFKVICLLGMNDGEFPRRDPPGSLNRLVAELDRPQRQPGDRSVRDDDRALFLQLLAAATQCFYLSYLGQDPRSGESRPPSVVVAELLDVAAEYFEAAADARDRLTVVQPLQPFTPAAFGGGDGDPRRFSYQAVWRLAADAAVGERAPTLPFAVPLPPPAAAAQLEWTREQLLRALSNPSREFLCERLGLRLPEADERLPEAEPFDTDDGLDRYQRDQRVLALCLAGPELDADAVALRLLAEGLIPPGAAGRAAVSASLAAVALALNSWRGRGEVIRALPYTLELGEFRLSGNLPVVAADGLRQFSASKAHGKTVLALGLDALVWAALGETQPIERIVSGQPRQLLTPVPAAAARAKLQSLLTLALRARRELLPFMPRAGLAYAQKTDEAAAIQAARTSWTADKGGEGHDRWVRVALRGNDPFADGAGAIEGFGALARGVFAGIPAAVDGDARVTEASDDGNE